MMVRQKEQDEQCERKRRRPSNAHTATMTPTPAQTPSLASWVIPWALVVGIAVIMAVYTAYSDDTAGWYQHASSTAPPQQQGTAVRILRRMLTQSQSYTHPHPQSHQPVYSEEHAPLFPLTKNDYIGYGLAVAGLMVAAGGGIGGGGILVPIYILVMGFSPKHAIPLSNVTVLGGAVANTLLNTIKRHPLADRPLVDWDLILVMEPLTIAGALMGAVLNKVLPETLLVILLVLLLSITAHKSLKQAVKMYKKETQLFLQEAGRREDGTQESELTRMAHQESDEDREEAVDSLLEHMEADDGQDKDGDLKDVQIQQEKDAFYKAELHEILEEERVTPPLNIMILVTMFTVVLAINLLKGGGAFPSPIGIQCGSTSFWMANFIMLAWIVLISFFVRAYLVRRFEIKKRCLYPYVEGDIEWDGRATIIYPCICCLAGFMAGECNAGPSEGPPKCALLSIFIYLSLTRVSVFFSRHVWGGWRNCQGTSHARHERSPGRQLGDFGLHDSFYIPHSHNILYRLWTHLARLCCRMLGCWVHCNRVGTSGLVLSHSTGEAQLVHCLFDWSRRSLVGLFDDHSIAPQYGLG
jgi:hypothetical protein